MIPWFIPTKDDQRKCYNEELRDTPKEVSRLIAEFSELSRIYNEKLGNFEARLSSNYELYELYLEVKNLAQKVNFIWNRIEYKQRRENELQEMLRKLN